VKNREKCFRNRETLEDTKNPREFFREGGEMVESAFHFSTSFLSVQLCLQFGLRRAGGQTDNHFVCLSVCLSVYQHCFVSMISAVRSTVVESKPNLFWKKQTYLFVLFSTKMTNRIIACTLVVCIVCEDTSENKKAKRKSRKQEKAK